MPQDPPRDAADTVRLQPDGTIGRSRSAPPVPQPSGPAAPGPAPTAEQPAVEEPAAEPSDTQLIPPVPDEDPPVATAPDTAAREGSDTQVIGPAHDTDPPGDSAGPPGQPPAEAEAGGPWWRRRALLVPAAAVLALGVAYGVDLVAAGDHVPRGTVVAGVELGGLSPAAASDRLESDLAPRVVADRPLAADDVEGLLHPPDAGIALDVPRTVDTVDDQPLNPWTRLTSLFADRTVDPVLAVDRTSLDAQVEQLATTVDRAPVDATITLDGTTPSLVEPVDGRTLDRDGAADAITAAVASAADPASPVDLPVDVAPVRVERAEAQRVLDETVTPALAAPVTVAGADGADAVDVPESAIAASLTFTPQDDGTLAVAVDPTALQTAMGEEFATFGSPAQDARFEVSGDAISVVPSVDGQGIDPAQLAEQLLPVLDDPAPRSVTPTLGPVPAAFTTEQAQALGITEQVSTFTTNFTSSASGTNIRVVAEEVDGAVVKPGETFSLNDYTGPRGTAQGYVPAAVISGGELSQAVGGGISQFATTMFNAVFFAGLEDVYHKPHSFYISRYPAGREATVYEGAIDLQWRNDTDTGIYVQTEWVPGALTVTFWGTKHYEVESVSGPRRNLREPAVQDKVDDGNCTPQSGSTGFDITVTRVFKDPATGTELRREDFDTHYAAEAVIRCVPPADPAAGQPATTGTPAPATPAGRRPGARPADDVRARARRRRR
ncbi:Putative vancomycin resistance protein [Modestobacter italicus]|uniref:Vancomycin resistance protein n=1 Tax=Modestobacter italicus (strain DSM 44449 / CECT 9708 / BC 501) TaxID=2732864 RepID=I4F126_MODI5|nr:VanW family protein [Modestobacter marinus]CCH89339.1 Putative vancomycin resistance protein [Modestobacter marinus]